MKRFALALALVTMGCSSSSSSPPPNNGDGNNGNASSSGGNPQQPAPLAPPAQGMQLATTQVNLAAGGEQYTCWSFKAPDDGTLAIVGLDNQVPTIGVHHWAVFTNSDPMTTTAPWSCETMGVSWGLVSGGGIGTPGVKFPDGTSMNLPAGQHIVVQLHLLNANTKDVQIAPAYFNLVSTKATNLQQVGLLIAGTLDITVPAHQTNVTVGGGCKPAKPLEHIFSVFPHMHQLGKRITAEVQPQGGGASQKLADQAWGFADQKLYPVQGSTAAGDQVQVTCTFDNPGDKDVHFGLSTHDEMCLNVLYYYPAMDPAKPSTYCGFGGD
jgi:hypothetical protein